MRFHQHFCVSPIKAAILILLAGLLLLSAACTPPPPPAPPPVPGDVTSAPPVEEQSATWTPSLASMSDATATWTPTNTRVVVNPPTKTFTPMPETKGGGFVLDTPRPEDVMAEMTAFGKGGGVECESVREGLWIEYESSQRYLMESAVVVACGWKDKEQVKVTIFDPAGNGMTQTETAGSSSQGGIPGVAVRHEEMINGQVGKFVFRFEGESGSIESTIQFVEPPNEPAMYSLSPADIKAMSGRVVEESYLLLDHFNPNESVRMLVYSDEVSSEGYNLLAGSRTFQTGPDGRLYIAITSSAQAENSLPIAGKYVAVGEVSGEVHESVSGDYGYLSLVDADINFTCPGAMPTRLVWGGEALAAYTDGGNLRIRKEPNFNSEIATTVKEGTRLQLIGGPRCVDKTFWFRIWLSEDSQGWAAETYNGQYILEPAR